MQTRSEMELELQQRLMTSNNSGLVPASRLTTLIQDATIWAGSLFFWPSLQRPRQATAVKNTQGFNYDYYDYPPDFLTGSVSRLYIDNVKYFPKAYLDLLDYADSSNEPTLQANPSNKYYSSYGRQFFVYPSYTATGNTNNLNVWGNIQHPSLSNPTDTTIFSLWNDTGNEAIVKKAMSVALKRLDGGVAAAEEKDAVGLLTVIWGKVTAEMQKNQRLNHQMFAVPDYFGFGSGMSSLGNFNIPVEVINSF